MEQQEGLDLWTEEEIIEGIVGQVTRIRMTDRTGSADDFGTE